DGWGWDIPLPKQAEQYKKTKEDNILWAAHFVGKEKEYCQIEKLANLDQLPNPTGFKVACFPINIKSASAGWARPVAIFHDYEVEYMTFNSVFIIMFTAFLLILLGGGLITRKWVKNSNDFLIAGREVGLVVNIFGVA